MRGGAKLPVDAYDRDLKNKLAMGTLLTIDNQIDQTTGTVRFKGSFPNEDNALFPNQFVNARLLVDTKRNVVIIPAAAIQRSPDKTFVYVVKPDNTVEVRDVVSTLTEGDQAAIDSGLEPGDMVVIDGVDKLQPGAKVTVGRSGREGNAAPQAAGRTRAQARKDTYEPVPPIHSAAGSHISADGRAAAGGRRGLPAAAGLGAAAGGLSDHPGAHVLSGRSPDVMASSVTAPLERQFGQVPGLEPDDVHQLLGKLHHHAAVRLELNIDVAEQQVQAAINAGSNFLPRDLPNPPIYSKTNPADTPILTLALTSKTLPLSKVEDLADTRLAQKISQLPGVGLVSIGGGQKPAVRIQANPTALSSFKLNLEDLRTAIAAANVNQAKGNFDGKLQDFTIGANDQLLTSADYRPLVIAYRNGAPVVLSDVADRVSMARRTSGKPPG